jgi:hypothetical protein
MRRFVSRKPVEKEKKKEEEKKKKSSLERNQFLKETA